MNALFALALLASSSWAGVVMPVENGVAPSGPSAPVVPVLTPSAGSLGMPSFGSGADLRGALPLLPAPVPGLAGPRLNFIGNAPEAAPAHPEAGAAQVSAAPATAPQGRSADKTPALPAKASPGSLSTAISLDRTSAARTPGGDQSLSRARGNEEGANPLIESSALKQARPEKAAGFGRRFFDLSNDKDRAALSDAGAARSDSSARPVSAVAETNPEDGSFGSGYRETARLAASNAAAAFGAGHGPSQNAVSYAPEGEALHDAVASAPGAAAVRGAAVFFRSAAPNGELPSSAGVASLPVLDAPRPLALDLSRAGLIVRVRSALNGVISPVQLAVPASKFAAPGTSTALLERGAMLEAFSVASNYANSAPSEQSLTAGGSRAAAPAVPPAPLSEPATVPLWWAWFILPLFVAAVRGIL